MLVYLNDEFIGTAENESSALKLVEKYQTSSTSIKLNTNSSGWAGFYFNMKEFT